MERKGFLYSIIRKRKATIVIIFILFVIGAVCFNSIPKQQFPIIQMPAVIITTVYPGASSTDIEELVTDKIEEVCMQTTGFDSVKSESYNNVSVVRMMYNKELEGDDLQEAIDELRINLDALKENELPSGITKMTFNDNSFETCGIILAFTGENKSNEELAQRANTLKDKIIGTEGISRVDTEGELERQVKIIVDTSKLSTIPVSLSELSNIISYQNSIIPTGTIEFENNEIYVDSSGKFSNLDEIRDIIIYGNSQTSSVVKLRDIADVEMSLDSDDKRYKYNGNDAVILSVYFDEDYNILNVSDKVLKIIKDYEKAIPRDININQVVYLADEVNSSINDFILNLIESVSIVLLIVMLGMNIRNGSIVAFVIPFTIFLTFIAMKIMGIDVQFVSLASLIIALGMLVDNAIVVSDAIQIRIDNGEEKIDACVNGTKEVALPVFSSMLTTIAIFCIFYNLPGTMRRFIFSLPTIVITALVFSYIISMFVTPLMCYIFMKKTSLCKKSDKVKKEYLRQFFSNTLSLGIKYPKTTLAISLLCVALGIGLLSCRELQLMPNSDKLLLDIDIETDNINSINNTQKAVDAIINVIEKEENVEYYLASVGGRVPKYDFTTVASNDITNSGSLVIKIKKPNDMSKPEYCKYLESKLIPVTSAKVIVKEVGIMPKSSEAIQLNVCGEDIENINAVAAEVTELLKADSDAKDVYADMKVKTLNYYINIDNEVLNSYGLTKAEVQNELNLALMGRKVTSYRQNSHEYPIILESEVSNLNDFKNLQVKSSRTGGKYKISQVAVLDYTSSYNKISHFNGERCITITALPNYKKSAVVIANRLKNQLDKMNFNDVTIQFEGDSDTFQELTTAMQSGARIGILAIFLILYLQFYSVKRSLIILLTVPFAIIGSAIGLTIFNENLSLFVILGIISLIGVVVNNAIVLVDYMDSELKKGLTSKQAAATAVDKRFRPIMLSTTTTVLGLVPLAFTGNILFKGMAIAFMCGLSTSLFFTLIVIPVMYSATIKELPVKE